MFDHKQWTKDFIKSPGSNDAVKNNVLVVPNNSGPWKVIGVHHLTPDENRGKHNIYIDCLNEAGRRAKSEKIAWEWEGRRSDEEACPLKMDKPVSEVPNIEMRHGDQDISIWHPDGDSVIGIKASHPDEKATDGSIGNSIGHHSFLIVFQKNPAKITKLVPEPALAINGMEYKFIVPEAGEDQMRALEKESEAGWLAFSVAVINGKVHHYLRRAK